MDEKLHMPIRNHIEFPDVPKKRKTSFQELRKNVLAKKKKSVSKEMPREEIGVRTKTPKILDKVSISVTENDGSLNASSGQAVDLFNKQKSSESTKKPSKETEKSMNKGKTTGGTKTPKVADRSREGELFPATSIDEYVELSRGDDGDDDVEDNDEGEAIICS
ncbi:hypothetical protein QJS10_CPA10g02003 [Acorus calamus]|uniref:Uncharacterized protein n=1 Tax=Acorus calamus TaxID=4465 RepID=A0AAV9E269_ACOCL|nr:hypothetical protein QJS10_CPA10g02003 [Acorus calamus]